MAKQNDIDSQTLLRDLKFCVFDLETTGGNHEYDKIIEIGLLKIENLEITEKMSYLIQPDMKIPEFIQKLTSIGPKDLKDSPRIEEVVDEILDFIGDTILVAHNASFDVPFFNSVLRRLERPPLENNSICTNLMTRFLIPEILNSNLTYMSQLFNIDHGKAHRALEDAMAAGHLLLAYLKIFGNKNISKVNQLYYPRNRFELDRFNFPTGSEAEGICQKLLTIDSPVLITIKGDQGIILSVLPIYNTTKEINFIRETFQKFDYKVVTIRMVGSFLQAFLQLNLHFTKLDKEERKRILDYLYQTKLPGLENQNKSPESEKTSKENDFIIAKHLIPGQFVIYPLQNLGPKCELIFRYPSHKKKLQQYMNSQLKRIRNRKKNKRDNKIQLDLNLFWNHYLNGLVTNNLEPHFFISKVHGKLKFDKYEKQFEEFTAKSMNHFNFPIKHL